MSYSFSARGATKAEVMEKVTAEFDKVVASQPIHSADRSQAQAAAEAFLGVIPANASTVGTNAGDQDFYVSVNGSVSWNNTDNVITSASVSVSASLVAKVK